MSASLALDRRKMEHYLLIKHLHIVLALSSGVGFALRGFITIVLGRKPTHRLWKILPHLLDTLLLASGVTLWVLAGWPLMSWLGFKLLLVVAYILLGIAAFRAQRQPRAAGMYLLALTVFLGIAATALYRPV